MSDVILECRDIHKAFGGVPVLSGVSLALEAGTVTALAGENGAGKSTLLKIASGQYRADSGSVHLDGRALPAGRLTESRRLGLAIVPQELASINDLTVYENLLLGREIHRAGMLNRRAMIRAATEALSVFDVDIDPQRRMGSLPIGLQQIVEIVKASQAGARILLLDEPTSAISEREIEGLFGVVRRLREHGVAMVYTTHKMAEMRALADRVVVLRDGALVLDQPMVETEDDEIVTAMIGRELGSLFPPVGRAEDDVTLEVRELQVEGARGTVSVSVRRGEIVGLAGLIGAGRTELLEALFGIRPSSGGTVTVNGRPVRLHSPSAAIKAGMAFVPEDRKNAGAVLGMSVLDNASLPRLASFSIAGWLQERARTDRVQTATSSVRLRSRGLSQEVGTLSGGNQQKVVLARWLTETVDVLLLDEPTRGVDVGARSEIYKIITELADAGMAVLMASSDMPEILGLSHRALVLREGAVVGELDRDQLDDPDVQATLFHLASGTASPRAAAPSADDPRDHHPPRQRTSADEQSHRHGAPTSPRTPASRPSPASRCAGSADPWFAAFAVRHSMLIVVLLVIAYFSYRSLRFATLDNADDDPHRRRTLRAHRARPDPGDPHRRHRPLGRQRDRDGGDDRRRGGQGEPRADLAGGGRRGRRRPAGGRGQRVLRVGGQRAALHRHLGHAHGRLRHRLRDRRRRPHQRAAEGLRGDRQHAGARPADPGHRDDRRDRRLRGDHAPDDVRAEGLRRRRQPAGRRDRRRELAPGALLRLRRSPACSPRSPG